MPPANRPSPKPRWTLLVLASVVLLTAILGLLEINSLIRDAMDQSLAVSELTLQQAKQVILSKLQPTLTTDVAETKREWRRAIANDPSMAGFLETTTAKGPGFVEISIASENQQVIASSNRARIGDLMPRRNPLADMRDAGFRGRWSALFGGHSDFESRLPLALSGETSPLFTVQVLVSPILLRNTLAPAIRRIALGSLAVIGLAVLLAWLAARAETRQLRRVAGMIDRIADPSAPTQTPPRDSDAPELAVIESKLNLLGQEYRGAMRAAADLRVGVDTMLEQLEEALFLFDRERKLVMSGGAAARLLGAPGAPAPGTGLHAIWPIDTATGRLLDQAVQQRRILREQEVAWPAIRARHLLSLDWTGEQFVIRIRDAEGSRKVQNQLDLFARLDAINRLTAGVAHEIKNPLNSIAARIGLMDAMLEDGNPEMRAEMQIVANEVDRLDRVVRTFLDFASPVEMRKEPFELSPLVEEVADLVRADGKDRDISVQFAGRAGTSTISGDRDLLKQALLNVAVNGMESMSAGGSLRLEVREAAEHYIVSIADTGSGIPPALQTKIFQLYFTTKERGSGIGLAMTFKTVQLHGGSVEFTSQPGQGTRFDIRLPKEGA